MGQDFSCASQRDSQQRGNLRFYRLLQKTITELKSIYKEIKAKTNKTINDHFESVISELETEIDDKDLQCPMTIRKIKAGFNIVFEEDTERVIITSKNKERGVKKQIQ